MLGNYILDENRTPIEEPDIIKWGAWMKTSDRTIRKTHVGKVWVSTVFLGLDHNFCGGPPLLYETMIFEMGDEYQERYATEQEAIEGHERALQVARECVRDNP